MNKEEIKELRLKMDLSQQAFSNKLGVSVTSVNRWETGDFKPNHFTLKELQKLWNKYNKAVDNG
jgi:DNA-binding transcriptional regulator YiaG